MAHKPVIAIIRWLVIIAIPFLLATAVARIVIAWDNPSYPEWSYARIEPDRYGFTPDERLALADATLAYLRRPEPAGEAIYLLEALRMPGTAEPLYNEREISHMLDVKIVADAFTRVMWALAAVAAGGLAFLLARAELRPLAGRTLLQGGLLTLLIVVGVMLFLAVGWEVAFTLFHDLFFPPGTWTFAYSDSLIRLFPERFWFEFGLLWTGAILAAAVIFAVVGYALQRAWRR